MQTDKIKTAEPFDDLFPIDATTLDAIADDMRRNGYDALQPIILWQGKGCVIDGHTRLEAARLLKISDVPVVQKAFADEDAAVAYAIHCQRDRRNLTDADIQRWVRELRVRREVGRPKEEIGSPEPINSEKERIAKIIGTSSVKVQKAMTIEDHAPAEVKAAVASGEKSINAAYEETQERRKEERKPAPRIPTQQTPDPQDLPEPIRSSVNTIRDQIYLASRNKWKSVKKHDLCFALETLITIAQKG